MNTKYYPIDLEVYLVQVSHGRIYTFDLYLININPELARIQIQKQAYHYTRIHSSMFILTLVVLQALAVASPVRQLAVHATDQMQIAKDGCPAYCGEIQIPYPFGIGDGCFYNSTEFDEFSHEYGYYYNLTCNSYTNPPTLIYGFDIPVLNITLDDHSFRISSLVAYDCYENNQYTESDWPSLSMVEFRVSSTRNKFVAIGCDTKASISGTRFNEEYFTGCMTYCTSMDNIDNGTCSGVGCCETLVPYGTTNIHATVDSYYNHSHSPFNPCSAAFVVEDGVFNFSLVNLTYPEAHFKDLNLPTVFDWSILDNVTCASTHPKLCGLNTHCINGENATKGYRCKCQSGYTGNPYLPQGCKDVIECLDLNLNQCEKQEYCENNVGGYVCNCPSGLYGNATKSDPCKPSVWNSWPTAAKVTVVLGICLIIFIVGPILLHLYHAKKKIVNLKRSFFKENGGLVLHQKLRDREISIQKFKIFTVEELEKATANFSQNNVVGRGGFGMVYKGTLNNGQMIAIKKSLKVDPNQVEQFINETLILSEINNRNVVKLLGCCLDTEVPLLVYEFINNGTLYEHLQDERKASVLSWEIRLSIAEAVASVLSYLHTTISIPIIHRDMKSMNILLDENYTAKVSDFGASKLVPMDQHQLATVVLGTCGYLDPEYMQTNELTPKSDVYSFGVVLVELLTRKKAFCYDKSDPKSTLAMHFLCKMKDHLLFDIVDREIMMNENLIQVKEVAELARRCLSVRGDERPTMKEVAIELDSIRKMSSLAVNNMVTLSTYYESSLTYPVEDNDKGITSGSITTNIPSLPALDLEDGR